MLEVVLSADRLTLLHRCEGVPQRPLKEVPQAIEVQAVTPVRVRGLQGPVIVPPGPAFVHRVQVFALPVPVVALRAHLAGLQVVG